MSSLSVVLPYPPTANNLFCNVKGRGRVKTLKYKAWLEEAGLAVTLSQQRPIAGPYSLRIQAGRPDKRRRDLGNIEKSVSDCLVAVGAVSDDSEAQKIEIEWVSGLTGIRVLVLATERRG